MNVFLVGGEAAGEIIHADNRHDYVSVVVRGDDLFPSPSPSDEAPVPIIHQTYRVHGIWVKQQRIVFGAPPDWDMEQLLLELQRGYKEMVDLKRRFE